MAEKLRFEWDERKNQANIEKHGVRFETAILAFYDKNHIERIDEEHSFDEDRYQMLGRAGRDIFFIVYTKRNDKIRLISARYADREERSLYLC